jgi:prevent-host-death family protein
MPETISSTKLRANLKDALSYIKTSKKPLIVTERGEQTTVLVDIDEFEDLLMYNDEEFMSGLKKSRQQAQNGEVQSLAEIKAALDFE